MKYGIQNIITRKWFTYHNMRPWFTDNSAIRYLHDDPMYLLDVVKTLPDSDRLIVTEVKS